MSKVAISGNASGTGVFTIASPNSNTDRTLNLPDNSGTVLTTATPGVPVNGPAFSAYQSAGTTCNSGVVTKIACNTEVFDTNSNYNTGTYAFQPTVAGYYQVTAATTATGTALITPIIYKNGTGYREGVASTNSGRSIATALIYLNGLADYVELYVYNGTGLTVTMATPLKDTAFEAAMVRAA